MPGPQNKSQKDERKANNQKKSSGQSMVVPIAANTLNTVGPILSTVSTAAGYSWRVNVTGTMVTANIGSACTFAANTLNFWGARNDYINRRSEISEEIMAMPKICDSGIGSVTLVTENMPMDEDGYYFYKDGNAVIFAVIKDSDELKTVKLAQSDLFEQNGSALQDLLFPIISQEFESLSKDKPKAITGKLGIALAYLVESLIEASLNLSPIKTLSREQKGLLTKNIHYVVYVSQILCLVACAVAAVAYGVATTVQTNKAESSDGYPNKYIDPILPLGYISASIAIQSIAYFISALAINSQNKNKERIEKEYTNIRAARDKLQVTSSQKQKIKESIAYFSSFAKQVHGVKQRCSLLLESRNEMNPDLFNKLILNELGILSGILDSIRSELKLENLDGSVSLEMAEVKDGIRDLSEDINTDVIESIVSIENKIIELSDRALCSIADHIKRSFLQEKPIHGNEIAIDDEVSVHVQNRNSPRFNA